MSYHAYVIVNPMSANGRTQREWPELRAALDKVLDRWDHDFTLKPGDASELARKAAAEDYEMIVSVGGDGTMNEVVSGLVAADDEPSVVKEGLILASVRRGTGGDFARYLGLDNKIPTCVAHLEGDRTRPCDLGIIEYQDHGGATTRRAFLNIASFGMSGLVDEKVNTTSKALGGFGSFLVGLGKALVTYKPQQVQIEADGEAFYEGPIVTAAVANGQYFGAGMRFAPEAEIDDGLFDLVLQTHVGAKEVLSVRDLYSGELINWGSVRHTRAKVVRAAPIGDARVLLDVDGEQPGVLPARFVLLPAAVSLKV